jgi:hypothetical protein
MYFDAGVRAAKRGELAGSLLGLVEPSYRAQLQRLVAQQLEAFERELTLALASNGQAFAQAATSCSEAALHGFAAAVVDVAVPQTPLDGELLLAPCISCAWLKEGAASSHKLPGCRLVPCATCQAVTAQVPACTRGPSCTAAFPAAATGLAAPIHASAAVRLPAPCPSPLLSPSLSLQAQRGSSCCAMP